jgi:hypothetical protein
LPTGFEHRDKERAVVENAAEWLFSSLCFIPWLLFKIEQYKVSEFMVPHHPTILPNFLRLNKANKAKAALRHNGEGDRETICLCKVNFHLHINIILFCG